MKQLDLSIVETSGQFTPVRLTVQQVLLAGYTGRDRDSVMAHIRELEALGVAPPERIPTIFVVDPELLTTETRIEVDGQHTSGEVEFFLLPSSEGWLVGVGSDHTDRDYEAIDVAASKSTCSKVLSASVWRYADVEANWDRLQLSAWVSDDSGRRLYQSGALGDFLSVDALLAELRAAGFTRLEARVVFGGTLPLLGGFAFSRRFEAELHDPVRNRSLRCGYAVEPGVRLA